VSGTEVEAGIRAWAAERRLPEAHVARWLELPASERAALLELAQTLHLRTGQFVTIFTLLEEIGVRENQPVAEVLTRREIRNIFAANESAPGKARALLDALRAIRFPQLHETLAQINARIAALKLPVGLRVVLPPNLSSDEVRVEVTAHGGAELKRLVEAVTAKSTELCRVADLLGGADEV
jgi:hypothetical protein